MIAELLDATDTILERWSTLAPSMSVRGDDFLVTAEFTRKRPIETTLYGSAASLIGAAHLMGLTDEIISDIGGTTTDIAGLCEGRPERNSNGALVGRLPNHGRGDRHGCPWSGW
jgi:N-methylhydantoinase A/oxoprolinase/acetone carboxylase beta subunit